MRQGEKKCITCNKKSRLSFGVKEWCDQAREKKVEETERRRRRKEKKTGEEERRK